MQAITDTHCHLNFNAFDADRIAVLHRAQQAGIRHIFIPGTDLQTSQQALELAVLHPGLISAGIGLHPNDCQLWNTDILQQLKTKAMQPGVVAIGEIGLDYYRMRNPVKMQLSVLENQLTLAAEIGLPVILHDRNSTDDLLTVLTHWVNDLRSRNSPISQRPGVLHSFDGSFLAAQQAILLGFKLGITGPVTFKNAEEKRKILANLPLDSLLVETDSPFLAPHPYRGQRNEPAYIPLIIDALATLFNKTSDEIAQKTTENANVLFAWGD